MCPTPSFLHSYYGCNLPGKPQGYIFFYKVITCGCFFLDNLKSNFNTIGNVVRYPSNSCALKWMWRVDGGKDL